MRLDRRQFLKGGLSGLAYLSTASTAPLWVSKSAHAISMNAPEDRILVIYQMAGGNDGLNTVIPYTDPKYNEVGSNALRPTLHITSGLNSTLLGDGLNAFHPKWIRLKDWYSEGKMAVIQNVGYPNPSLSHFTGTDNWELGVSTGSTFTTTQGWASRFYDNQCEGMPTSETDPMAMLAAGIGGLPLTLSGSENYIPPAVLDFDSYAINTPASPAGYGDLILNYISVLNDVNVPINSSLDFIQRASNIAQVSVEDMEAASMTPVLHPYPAFSNQLGPGLEMVSRIIRTNNPKFNTKIFYVTQNGYDTHANQFDGSDPINNGMHPFLLDEADQCVDAFMNDMYDSGNMDRVLLLSFSEFGRRPQENGSNGTDHGTANCLFALGGGVNGGVYGGQPDLAPLTGGNQGGNLAHAIDFRSVYSIVLRDWLGVDPALIFGVDYTNPGFDIQGGMAQIPFVNPEAGTALPASNTGSALVGAALTAAAGAAAVRFLARDETPASSDSDES